MTEGTEDELAAKAARFLKTLEIGAEYTPNGRGLNSQTGHKIEIDATRAGRFSSEWTYVYRVDGSTVQRDHVLALLRGEHLGKVGSA